MRVLTRRRHAPLPYTMFDLAREAYAAKKGETIENIYHMAHERAWSGKEVLAALLAEHGEPQLDARQKEALSRVFAIILWGELGAWKISAQLADALEPLEARMAATSQSFDEARHFYTMYDYLTLLGYVPKRIDRASELVLDLTLRAEDLAHKVCGMQLMIETIALTLFRTVRESGIEPVLCNLLRYYELDEARHIGLGVNYLPALVRQMTPLQRGRLALFQVRILAATVYSLWHLRGPLRVLGIDPRLILARGKAKQFEVFREMWSDVGVDVGGDRMLLDRVFAVTEEVLFPQDEATPLTDRLRRGYAAFFAREGEFVQQFVDETREEVAPEQERLAGMAKAGERYWTRRRGRRKPDSDETIAH